MIRLYALTEGMLIRTGRQFVDLAKALDRARKIDAPFVEVRETTPQGKECLRHIVKQGVTLDAL